MIEAKAGEKKMLQFGAMNNPVLPLMAELERVAAMGMNYLELTMDAPMAHYQTVKKLRKEIQAGLRKHGLGVVCHMPTFVSTADLTRSLRQASWEEVRHSLETAVQLGADKVVLHPSCITGLGPLVMADAMGYARDFLDDMVQFARPLGMTICLENMFPRCHAFYRPAHFQAVLDDHPDLQLTLDTGHASIADSGKRLLRFIRRHGNRIGHLHVSDNHMRSDEHLPVGAGSIDFPAVVRALKDLAYRGTVTLEIFTGEDRDIIESRNLFSTLWETA